MEELGVAFCAAIPAELRAGVEALPELERELRALVDRARATAPKVELDAVAFITYVGERATFDIHGKPVLQTLHAGDLWIAFGCVRKNDAALAAFTAKFGPEIKNALRRSFEPALADDAELQLHNKLLLVADDGTPRLASYAGRGALVGWLRAAAVRTAIELMRSRKELPHDPAALVDAGLAFDPLLAGLKQRYRDEFRVAFAAAAAKLTDRERTLLRYRFFDDLSIDEIGVLYRVHRATVARWIAATRETLFEETRGQLMKQLAITDSEVDSVLRLIDSELDISIESMMR